MKCQIQFVYFETAYAACEKQAKFPNVSVCTCYNPRLLDMTQVIHTSSHF